VVRSAASRHVIARVWEGNFRRLDVLLDELQTVEKNSNETNAKGATRRRNKIAMKSSETKHKLEVTIPGDHEVVMTRVFDAPRRLVFDAFTKPELIVRWLLGPDGWTMPVCEVDLRVGGKFHYVWRNDTEDQECALHGVYRDIAERERIVHVERFDEAWYPDEAIITTAFEETGGSTIVTMTCRYESREGRDLAVEAGMDNGVARSYERLDDVLAA
jgi:uncharacterized protein YndB with AHSA1/START domain